MPVKSIAAFYFENFISNIMDAQNIRTSWDSPEFRAGTRCLELNFSAELIPGNWTVRAVSELPVPFNIPLSLFVFCSYYYEETTF